MNLSRVSKAERRALRAPIGVDDPFAGNQEAAGLIANDGSDSDLDSPPPLEQVAGAADAPRPATVYPPGTPPDEQKYYYATMAEARYAWNSDSLRAHRRNTDLPHHPRKIDGGFVYYRYDG